MASCKVLVVLLVCAAAVSVQAAPKPKSRFLRTALSPLLNSKRFASFDSAFYSSMGPSYANFPSGFGPSFGGPSNFPGGFGPSFGGNPFGSYAPPGVPQIPPALMELLSRGCEDPLIAELGVAMTKLIYTHFLETEEMQGALGEQAEKVNNVSPEEIGMAACVIGNIQTLDELAALLEYEEGSEEAQMLPILYGFYVEMGGELVAMLEGQKELIDDPQAEEGIDLIVEIWDILGRMGLLSLQ